MTNYEIINTLISILALCVSFYALYLSQKRGKISIQFRIKFYQLIVDIVNVGGNPLVITDIDISLHRNGEDIVSVFPENLPNLPVELRSKGVIRLKNFTESIDTALKQYSHIIGESKVKFSVYVQTSLGDNRYLISEDEIDLAKSISLASQNKNIS